MAFASSHATFAQILMSLYGLTADRMFRNYIIVTIRNLGKHPAYSLINICGLALGLATSLLLVTWIRHELSYDTFHQNAPRIYRVSMEYSFGGHVAKLSVSPNALLPALLTLPETKTGVRVYNPSQESPYLVRYGNAIFEEDKFYYADSTFFDVFSFRLMKGNVKEVLKEPYSVLLTERMAKKYFGDGDPVGKTLLINNRQDYKVTGVMEDPPSNSHMQFDFLASFNSIPAGRGDPTWWSANYQTFMLLQENGNLEAVIGKTNDLVRIAVADEITGENDYVRYNFLPLAHLYLRSEFDEFETVGDIKYVLIFSGVTILILAIACINYINLATARAAGRAKEVGIRKVSGALRKQLFFQFIGESLVITLISFIVAFLLALILLPFFNALTGKDFSYAILFQPSFMLLVATGLLVVGFFAGAYPALALTGFNPVQVLKGNFRSSGKGAWLRKALVVFQFAISVILVAATLVVMQQLEFMQNKKLGFDRENTIVLPLDGNTERIFQTLKAELKRTGAALYVGRGSESPASIKAGYGLNTADQQGPGIITTGLMVDEEFISALGMELIAGREFTKEDLARFEQDSIHTFILNETALSELYIEPDHAVGSRVSVLGSAGEVIGVVKDFHFASLHKPIGPLVIFPDEKQLQKVFIKLPSGSVRQRLQEVQKIYSSLVTHRPFEFEFLDQQYTRQYDAEQRMGSISAVFASLAILIACLGLFGLVSFSAAQKKKEIGIRKVLGATASGILLLITRDFTKLIFLATIIGLPIAYWLTTDIWLSDFAYKVDAGIWPFLGAALGCFGIAITTTAFESLKASMVDPAEILRNE